MEIRITLQSPNACVTTTFRPEQLDQALALIAEYVKDGKTFIVHHQKAW